MPILAAETDVFPEELLSRGAVELAGRWWVLYTRARQEKSVARNLHKRRIPFFLPLLPRRYCLRKRRMESYLPLFPGYVFLFGDEEARVRSLTCGRIVRVLEVADQDRLWRDLRQIGRMLGCEAEVAAEAGLTSGVLVEIRSGPLAGLRGKIVTGASRRRFVVEVDFIQRGASVLLSETDLAVMV